MLRDTLGTTVELQKGRRGQFEVVVEGRTVLARKGGLLAKLLGRPWPTDDDLLTAVRHASESSAP